MIEHTTFNGIVVGGIILAGYFLTMWAMSHKGKHTFKRCWMPLVLGLAIFFGGWGLEFSWMPDSTFHCTQHCFPWGN